MATAELEQALARAAARDAYRLALADALRDERDPDQVYALGTRMLATHLRVNRATFGRIDGDHFVIEAAHVDGAPAVGGRIAMAVNARVVRETLAAGQPIAVEDVQGDSRLTGAEAESYIERGSRAFISVPLFKDGTWVGVSGIVSVMPREWRQDEIDLVIDTTERIWIAHERACAVVALHEANRRKDEFIAMLSHELRNPLAPLRTSVDVLRVAGADPSVAGELLAIMDRQLAHVTRLVDELLDAARITRGTIELRRTPAILREIVQTAVEAHRELILDAKLEVHASVRDGAQVFYADSTRIVQALSNLLHNATKFSTAGGRIDVTGAVDGDHVVLAVSDSGIGIAPALRARLFELFERGDDPRGLGIGLAMSRHIAELHDGTLTVDSAGSGLGSRFELRIPIVAPPATEYAAAADKRAAKRTIVIIDDNVDAARAIAMLAKVMGGVAHVAHDGPTGISLVREMTPSVIFVDIGMAGMDGYEVCRRIRREQGGAVTVVALTGWGKDEDRQRAVDAGFDAHVTKPLEASVLRRFL